MSVGDGLLFVLFAFLICPAIIASVLLLGDGIRDWWAGRSSATVDVKIPQGVLRVPKDLVAEYGIEAFAARLAELMREPVTDRGDVGGEAH